MATQSPLNMKTTTTTTRISTTTPSMPSPPSLPESVEEAGALLGATITRCGGGSAGTGPLGATGWVLVQVQPPPRGMHSAFGTVQSPLPSAELTGRLHDLRTLLHQHDPVRQGPLAAAPSLLAVLMKLVGVSNALATAALTTNLLASNQNNLLSLPTPPASTNNTTSNSTGDSSSSSSSPAENPNHPAATSSTTTLVSRARFESPPLLSQVIRSLWVQDVVACHVLAQGLTGTARVDTVQFVRKMMIMATLNPRSAKAAGGVRLAALQVMTQLLYPPSSSSPTAYPGSTLSSRAPSGSTQISLGPTVAQACTLELLSTCLKALRSAGQGEPTYREQAVQLATATVLAARQAYRTAQREKRRRGGAPEEDENADSCWIMAGALEDKALLEMIRILKQAVTDKMPAVRWQAAHLVRVAAPLLMLLPPPPSSGAAAGWEAAALEDVVTLASKQLDDEVPAVAQAWADALARLVCTTLQHHHQQQQQQQQHQATSAGDHDARLEGADSTSPGTSPGHHQASGHHTGGSSSTKMAGCIPHWTKLPRAISYFVDQFVRAGGELVASRAGGTYSVGGRSVRVGQALVLIQLLRLQSRRGALGEGRALSIRQALTLVLGMVDEEVEKQLRPPAKPETSGSVNPLLFGSGRTWSRADAGLARMATSRVLRQGLSEVTSEAVQLVILQELLDLLPDRVGGTTAPAGSTPNPYQLQVILVEASHLLVTLGEATASKMEEAAHKFAQCLSHPDHGVRYEAATACTALARCFPPAGRDLLQASLTEIQHEHAELVTLASNQENKPKEQQPPPPAEAGGLRMFRRPAKEKTVDLSLPHQSAIHGRALLVSLMLMDLPLLEGGLPADLLATSMSVAEVLVSCQFHDLLTAANPVAVCFCVRAGFAMISGALATGPAGITPHISLIFGTWQKAVSICKTGGKHLLPWHDLFCLDSLLTSMVAFLKYCSELLLSIPEALSRVTVLLEDALGVVMPKGRLGSLPLSIPIATRLDSATASILESFAWLPAGSFPMAADDVFAFAAAHIRNATENDVTCSILPSLISKEDAILDAKALTMAKQDGQIGGADLEETIIALNAEVALPGERESVMHLQSDPPLLKLDDRSPVFRESRILKLFASTSDVEKPPTPLHEVGTWRKPLDPSSSSKVRLVDAAIQAFSATFGLKSGKEQQSAMDMLESLVPPLLAQLARTLGVNSALAEQDRRSKAKEDSAAVANIAAVLLSCLQALPLHEATHNVPIGLGPAWMNKAKDLLLTVLPSPSTMVRRAAAEGLALLATVGVSEDARFLQSTVLHSLDELMQGNKPDGKPRSIALEPISAARSGSLLTLACIQRTAHSIRSRQMARAEGRLVGASGRTASVEPDSELPLLQMMTRILPWVAPGMKDSFVARTYALHSFALLLGYSSRLESENLSDEDLQLIRKAVELVEDNVTACWSATTESDKTQEVEKVASEAAFLAVLVRLMTFLLPYLHHIHHENPFAVSRLSMLVSLILEMCSHPVVTMEAMAFHEVVAAHARLLTTSVNIPSQFVTACITGIPSVLSVLSPLMINPLADSPNEAIGRFSVSVVRSAVCTVRAIALFASISMENVEMTLACALLAQLENGCGSRFLSRASFVRSVATSREVEAGFLHTDALEIEVNEAAPLLLAASSRWKNSASDSSLLRWILLGRAILSGNLSKVDSGAGEGTSRSKAIAHANSLSAADLSSISVTSSSVRWQVKCLGARLASFALEQLIQRCEESGTNFIDSPHFNLPIADQVCKTISQETGGIVPNSWLSFHLKDVLAAACLSSTATVDQAEIATLQEPALYFLNGFITSFGRVPDPEEPGVGVLNQFSTQIFSAIRHSLNQSSHSRSSQRLIVAGCRAIQSIVDSDLTVDPMVLKRMIRPLVPSSKSLDWLKCINGDGEGQPDDFEYIMPFVAKTQTSARILLGSRVDSSVASELLTDKIGLALASAALSIDGSRILTVEGLSLTGQASECDPSSDFSEGIPGFFVQDLRRMDDELRGLLMNLWSSCASCAILPILEYFKRLNDSEEARAYYMAWLAALSSLFISGIKDSLSCINSKNVGEPLAVTMVLDPIDILVDCLRGVAAMIQNGDDSLLQTCYGTDLEQIVQQLATALIQPSLLNTDPSSTAASSAIAEACLLLRSCAAYKGNSVNKSSTLLIALLSPMDILRKSTMRMSDGNCEEILATCLVGMADLIGQSIVSDSVVRSMLSYGDELLSSESEKIRHAAQTLLHRCLRHECINDGVKFKLSIKFAGAGSWTSWRLLAATDEGRALSPSLPTIRSVLRDAQNWHNCVQALSALVALVQEVTLPSLMVGELFFGVGSEILGALYLFGTGKVAGASAAEKARACADSVKLTMIGLQQLSLDPVENQEQFVAAFLSLWLGILVAMVQFHGLPNSVVSGSASTSQGGEVTLGRLAAQTLVHVARTAPTAFKSSVSTLPEAERQILELAVRGEMSGYTNTSDSAPKKKLNLSGFKK